MKCKSGIALLSALVAGGFLTTSAANASFILRLSTGATNVFIVNDDPTNAGTQRPDANPNSQLITYTAAGFGGEFDLTVTTGFSNSPGDVTGSILQVNTIDIRNTSAGTATLHVQLEDTGFLTPSGNNMLLESSLSGNLVFAQIGNEVDFESWADANNNQGGMVTTPGLQPYVVTSLPANQQSTIAPALTNTTLFSSNGSNPYSLTNALDITLSPNAQANITGTTSVIIGSGNSPEPASLLLLGVGEAEYFCGGGPERDGMGGGPRA